MHGAAVDQRGAAAAVQDDMDCGPARLLEAGVDGHHAGWVDPVWQCRHASHQNQPPNVVRSSREGRNSVVQLPQLQATLAESLATISGGMTRNRHITDM